MKHRPMTGTDKIQKYWTGPDRDQEKFEIVRPSRTGPGSPRNLKSVNRKKHPIIDLASPVITYKSRRHRNVQSRNLLFFNESLVVELNILIWTKKCAISPLNVIKEVFHLYQPGIRGERLMSDKNSV